MESSISTAIHHFILMFTHFNCTVKKELYFTSSIPAIFPWMVLTTPIHLIVPYLNGFSGSLVFVCIRDPTAKLESMGSTPVAAKNSELEWLLRVEAPLVSLSTWYRKKKWLQGCCSCFSWQSITASSFELQAQWQEQDVVWLLRFSNLSLKHSSTHCYGHALNLSVN